LSFRGQFEHRLDAKDRLTVPSKFRAALADGVVLLKGLHPSVWVFSPEGYESFTQRFLGQTNPLGSKGRDMRLYFAGNSFDDTLDSAGRIRVPKKLIGHASLSEGPCAIVGAEGWFEVWNPESWSRHEQRIDAEIVDVAENLAEGA
jgi:transcriptional regulator MraZ